MTTDDDGVDGVELGSADDGAGSSGDKDSDEVPSASRQASRDGHTTGPSCRQDTGRLPWICRSRARPTLEVRSIRLAII